MKRGAELSDRVGDMPTLEQRMGDVRAVMDAARGAHVLKGVPGEWRLYALGRARVSAWRSSSERIT